MTMFSSITGEIHQKCRSCQSDDLISDHCTGDVVCRSCGTVFGDHFVSDEPEWRDYENRSGDNSRASMVEIGGDDMEHRVFSGGKKEDRDLLNRIQNSGYTKKEMKMFDSFSNLEQLTFKLGLSDGLTTIQLSSFFSAPLDRAKEIFKKAYLAKLGSRDALVAGVAYHTCLIENSPRTMGEISLLSGVPLKKINRIYQLLTKEPTISNHGTTKSPLLGYVQLHPADLIGRMASQLKLSQTLISTAREACQKIVQCELMNGSSPQIIAAGVLALIFVATKQQWRITDLMKVSFSSEQAIKKSYQQLQQDTLTIFSRQFISSIGGITHIPLHIPETN